MDFDEFRAVTKRQKGSKLVENNNVSSTGNDEEVSTSKDNELSKGDTGNSESTKDNDLLAQLKNDEQSTSSKSNSKGKSKKEMLNTGNAISSSINFITTYITNIVEQNEIQALYVGVLMIDTFCAFALLVFSFGGSANNEQRNNFGDASSINANAASMKFDDSELSRDLNALTSQLRNVLAAIYSFFVLENGYQHPFIQYVCIPTLQSICLFSLLFFCVEILLVLVAFQTRVLSHVGYMLDMVILSMQFYETVGLLPSMIQSNTSGMITYRLFNLVRCWRFFRLYTIYINIEVSKHMKTKRLLEDKVSIFDRAFLMKTIVYHLWVYVM